MTHTMSAYQYANNSPSLRNDPSGLKSPAPAGVSQMGWDRMQKIADWQSGNFSLDDWSDSFGGYDYYAGAQAGPFVGFWNSFISNAFGTMKRLGVNEMDYSIEGGRIGYYAIDATGSTTRSVVATLRFYVTGQTMSYFYSFSQQQVDLDFKTLWDDYGSGLSHTVSGQEIFPDYCAINLSDALIKSGMSPGGTKCWGNCSNNQSHTIRAQELATWLQGNLSGVTVLTGANFEEYISGKTGIVFFQNYWQREGEKGITGDHIDLWNQNEMGTYGVFRTWIRTTLPSVGQAMGMSDLSKSTQILFWEIK